MRYLTPLNDISYRRKADRSRFGAAVALAVLIHMAAWPLLLLKMKPPEGSKHPYSVSLLKNKSSKTAQKPRQVPKTRQIDVLEKKNAKLDGQIVALPTQSTDKAPDEAKFLSEANHRADKQSVSRHRRSDYQNPLHEVSTTRPVTAEAGKEEKKESTNTKEGEQGKEQKTQAGGLELPKLARRDILKLAPANTGILSNKAASDGVDGEGHHLRLGSPETSGRPLRKQGESGASQPDMKALIPSLGVLASLDGGPMNDHIEGIEEGDGTFLNSREFKYASFFNRLKRDVSQHWHPMDQYSRHDPTGSIYGPQSRLTVLEVTLRPDGRVQDLRVHHTSGLEFLDHEAIEAFRRAEPFPNPPKGLQDASGVISFNFGFNLDLSQRRGFRMRF